MYLAVPPPGDDNTPPVATEDTATTAEDTAVQINVLANDTDVDGTLARATVAVGRGPNNGMATVHANGAVRYTPNPNFNGTDTFTYTVEDNDGAISNVARVTITVTSYAIPAVQMPAELSNRAFRFADGNVFGIDAALGAATLTFGQFAIAAPFALEAGDRLALGMAALDSCRLTILSSTFSEQGPLAEDEILLDPCLIDAQDDDTLTVTNGDLSATSAPATASERILLPAILDGDQEVADPPVETDATGLGIVAVNAARDTIAFALGYGDIATNVVAAHIHAGAQGMNGDIIFFLCADTPPAGVVVDPCPDVSATLSGTLTAANFIPSADLPVATFAEAIEAISAGNTYFNVHSEAFDAGEIRGQIGNNTMLEVSLSGAQEVPPVETEATGEITVLINPGQSWIFYRLTVNDIDEVTVAHIHVGGVGVNGGPILFLCADGEPPEGVPEPINCGALESGEAISGFLTRADLMARPDDNITTFADAIEAILTGNAYVNVLSPAFPAGEIRGQFPTPPFSIAPLHSRPHGQTSSIPAPSRVVLWTPGQSLGKGFALRPRSGANSPEKPHPFKGSGVSPACLVYPGIDLILRRETVLAYPAAEYLQRGDIWITHIV
jgi:hypothetical protein